MQTRTADDGAFVMEWYAPAAVTALNDGGYQTTGKPYKTSVYSVAEGKRSQNRHDDPSAG